MRNERKNAAIRCSDSTHALVVMDAGVQLAAVPNSYLKICARLISDSKDKRKSQVGSHRCKHRLSYSTAMVL
jgi:hypothetical protein